MLPDARTGAEKTVKLVSELIRLTRKFNPNHHPAGSSIGGQFAPGFNPDSPVPSMPPADKTEIPGVADYWSYFNDAVADLQGVTPEFRFAASQIFAFEGGMTVRRGAPVAGIVQETLGIARRTSGIPGIESVSSSSKLTPRDVAAIYKWYADVALRDAGGSASLSFLGDHRVAAVVFDSVFHHGEAGGAGHLRAAIAKVFRALSPGDQRLLRDGGFRTSARGGRLRSEDMAQIGLLVSRGYVRKLLDAIAASRETDKEQASKGDFVRYEHFRFGRSREAWRTFSDGR